MVICIPRPLHQIYRLLLGHEECAPVSDPGSASRRLRSSLMCFKPSPLSGAKKESTREEMTAYQVTLYNLEQFKKCIAPHLIDKKISDTTNFNLETKDNISRSLFKEELDKVWTGTKRGLMRTYGFSRQHLQPKAQKRTRISADVVSPLTEVLDLPQTSKNLKVRWEEIIAITPLGEELVYDITVDDIHNFVGNNVLLHNCVYQEQVMLLSQKLADFSKGEADTLRKAMGKKKKALVDKMWPKFLEGCKKNGHPEKTVEKVWKDWEAFASYAFNKSHSTCYAFVAFQTAYLKAHYPAEFMASVLTHNKSDISKVTFFLRECKRMEIDVLGPNVNESQLNFTVNNNGQIRFGMSALKGVGEGPVEAIVGECKENGPFKDVFDMMRRLNLKAVNKRVMESLALGGGFDCFETMHRSQYFAPSEKYDTFIEHLLRYGNAYQLQKAQSVNSLFGDSDEILIPEPAMPKAETWSLIDKLTREKEVTGIFISGHPLDDYKMEVKNFTTCNLEKAPTTKGQALKLAGIVAEANHRISKKGTGFGFFTIQDYNGSMEFPLFGEDYQKFKHLFEVGQAVFLHGSFQKKWSGDGFQFKLTKVELLESVGTNMTSSLTLRIPIESLTKELVHNIELTCKAHQGKHKLKVLLVDRAAKMKLHLVAKTQTVNANNDLIAKLEKLGVAYQVS